jgi:hypothetical protein
MVKVATNREMGEERTPCNSALGVQETVPYIALHFLSAKKRNFKIKFEYRHVLCIGYREQTLGLEGTKLVYRMNT